MIGKKGKGSSSSSFGGGILLVSFVSIICLSVLALMGEKKMLALVAVVLSIPSYFVIFTACTKYLAIEKDGNRVLSAAQSTVEGMLDEKTKDMLDKDGDGKIMISEYFPLSEGEVLQKILAVDSQFSKEDFYAWTKHLYSLILEALDTQNTTMLRRYESDYLYQRHVAMFDDIKKAGAVISNYAVKGVLLKDFKVEGDKEILIVALSASINKKSAYDDTYKSYILTFARKKGIKTMGTLLDKETNCPNCGAVLKLDNQGVCSYCHSVVSNGNFGWILIDMKSIQLVGM